VELAPDMKKYLVQTLKKQLQICCVQAGLHKMLRPNN
jgi:hypothetical protein